MVDYAQSGTCRLTEIMSEDLSYNEVAKAAFHREAKKGLKALAKTLMLPAGSYDIRSNQGGIAVSGEVTLHGEVVYVQIAQSAMKDNNILFHRCEGRKDYTGGQNHFAAIDSMGDVDAFAAHLRKTLRLADTGEEQANEAAAAALVNTPTGRPPAQAHDAMAVPVVQSILLSQLHCSPLNVRKTASPEAFKELKASITAHGLLQPLIVTETDVLGRYHVIAGGRRLEALQQLLDDGALPADYAAPCQIRNDQLQELSLAENIVREAMHPADQFEVWRDLVADGTSVSAIAARFGVSEELVTKRLKLGRVHLDLLQAYRDDAMSLEMLMAFTLTDDQARQKDVWEGLKDRSYRPNAHQIRNALTETQISSRSRMGAFIDAKAYEAAGGTITRDLFSENDEFYFCDSDLVHKLADEKLEARAEELKAQGWKWVEVIHELDYNAISKFARIYPQRQPLSEEEETRLETLYNQMEEMSAVLEAEGIDCEEAMSETQSIDYFTLQGEIEALEGLEAYDPEEMAIAGCFVTIGRNGDFNIHAGLVRPEDKKLLQKGQDTGNDDIINENTSGKGPGYSQSLQTALTAYRRQVAQLHIAQNFEVAFDLMLFSLCRSVFHYGWNNPLELSVKAGASFSEPDDLEDTVAGSGLTELHKGLPLDWVKKDPMEAYAEMSLLSIEDKQRLFAWVVGYTMIGQLSTASTANPVFEMAGTQLDIDMAAHWRPDTDNFWQRIKKDAILEIAEDVLGKDWCINHNHFKKGELARKMGTIFAGCSSSSLAVEVLEKAKRWLPEGMGFGVDSITPEEMDHATEVKAVACTPDTGISEPEVVALDPAPISIPEKTKNPSGEDGRIVIAHVGTEPLANEAIAVNNLNGTIPEPASDNEELPDFLRDVG